MASWNCFATFICIILCAPSSISEPVITKPANKHEAMQHTEDVVTTPMSDVFHNLLVGYNAKTPGSRHLDNDSETPLAVQLSKNNNEIADILAEHQTVHMRANPLQAPRDNVDDNISKDANDTPASDLLFRPMIAFHSNDNKALHKDEITSAVLHSIHGTMKSHGESGSNQINKNKLHDIEEKSQSLIKRLCNVHTSKRQICYQRGTSTCYCIGGLADCSGKKYVPNISYAPKFGPSIQCLKFTFNSIRQLPESYFSNVTTFIAIDFSSNDLEKISSKTFERFTNLQYLILNYNKIGYSYLKAVLEYPPSFRLDIIQADLENIPLGYFSNYSSISTSQIYMDFNYITTLDLREFAKLDNITYLSLTNCSIQNVISGRMLKLKVLDLDNNNITVFPVTCKLSISQSTSDNSTTYQDNYFGMSKKIPSLLEEASNQTKKQNKENNNISLFPSLTDLYIGYNNLLALPQSDQFCLPNLKTLHLESNNITNISENAFMALRSLKVLILDKMNTGISKIGPSAFNIPTLTSLYMSKNRIAFDSSDISTQLFQGCTRLEVISIDHNKLSGVSEGMFEELLNHTPALRHLYLSSTNMNFIPVKAFSQLRNLERLYIYINDIKEIPPGAFDEMPSLGYLYIDENQISTIKENAFSLKTKFRLKRINLSRNEYLCDCNLLWFQSWLREAGPDQFMDFNYYRCSNINNMSVQGYILSKQACLFSREVYVLFVVCLSLMIVLFIVFALLYRYRWNIRLMIYERRAPTMHNINLSNIDRFRYDLFVVYSNDDCEWVEELLIPKLETQWRLQTCIHQRDFVAGGSIIDNIIESMNESKRILVVVSSSFARSKWCNFELQLCQSHVISHDLPSLIVILLDEVESRDMSAAFLALYNTTCFLEWPVNSADSGDISTFWKRLKRSLAAVIDTQSHCTSVKSVN